MERLFWVDLCFWFRLSSSHCSHLVLWELPLFRESQFILLCAESDRHRACPQRLDCSLPHQFGESRTFWVQIRRAVPSSLRRFDSDHSFSMSSYPSSRTSKSVQYGSERIGFVSAGYISIRCSAKLAECSAPSHIHSKLYKILIRLSLTLRRSWRFSLCVANSGPGFFSGYFGDSLVTPHLKFFAYFRFIIRVSYTCASRKPKWSASIFFSNRRLCAIINDHRFW